MICKQLISNVFDIVGENQQLLLTNYHFLVIFQLDINFKYLRLSTVSFFGPVTSQSTKKEFTLKRLEGQIT